MQSISRHTDDCHLCMASPLQAQMLYGNDHRLGVRWFDHALVSTRASYSVQYVRPACTCWACSTNRWLSTKNIVRICSADVQTSQFAVEPLKSMSAPANRSKLPDNETSSTYAGCVRHTNEMSVSRPEYQIIYRSYQQVHWPHRRLTDGAVAQHQ